MTEQTTPSGSLPTPVQVKTLICEDKPEDTVKWADQIGLRIAHKVATSQIRNIYGTVRQIEMNWRGDPEGSYRQAVLLRPKISYATARAPRDRDQGMKDLESVLVPALGAVTEAKDAPQRHEYFVRFVEFFEAILAYHKKHGGS